MKECCTASDRCAPSLGQALLQGASRCPAVHVRSDADGDGRTGRGGALESGTEEPWADERTSLQAVDRLKKNCLISWDEELGAEGTEVPHVR